MVVVLFRAGVYDIIYPAAHLSSSSSTAARPIIVAQPPASLRSLFPATPASSGQDGGLPGLEDARGSTYLGIAGGSLYAMGSSRFPLVAFTPRAALGLGGAPASPRRSERAEEQPLAEHPRGLLGSYRVETDEQAETLFQEAVLGRHHVLAIGDGTDGTGRDKLPTLPDHSTNEPAGDGAPGAGQIPLSSSKLVNDRKSDATPASGSANSSSSRPTLSEASSWRPSLAMFLMQVCAVLAIALLVCAVYLGLQEQKRAAERAAASIARDVVWVPALKEDEAGFSIEASEGSERKMGQGYGEQLSDEKAAELGAAFEPESQRAGPSALPAPSAKANLPEETTAAGSPETEQGTPKKKPARRRKRGKRAGGANKSANSKAHEGDGGEGEADEDEDEEDGEEGGRRPDKDEARGSQAESQPLGDALLQPSSLDGSQSARGKESAFEGRSALANPSEHLRGSEFDAEQDTQMTEGQIARLPAAANASAATEAPGSASVKANGTRTGTGASLVISEEVLGELPVVHVFDFVLFFRFVANLPYLAAGVACVSIPSLSE